MELSATAWQGNWAEIASAQVYMCEKTHLIVHLRCFSFAWILLLNEKPSLIGVSFENKTSML